MSNRSVGRNALALGGVALCCLLCLAVVAGTATAAEGEICPTGAPQSGDTANVTVDLFVAPDDSFGELNDTDAISDGLTAGRIVPALGHESGDPVVTTGRTRIYRLRFEGESTRVLQGLDGSEREIDRAVDRRLAAGGNVSFGIGVNTCSAEINLSSSDDAGAIEYAFDDHNDSIYVVVDPGAAVVDYPSLRGRGQVVELTVGNGTTTSEDSFWFDVQDPDAQFVGGEPLHLNTSETATVTGSVTALPGTDLRIVLNISGEPNPRRTIATVGSNRRFTATFDLSSVPQGTRATASVVGYRDSETVAVVGSQVSVNGIGDTPRAQTLETRTTPAVESPTSTDIHQIPPSQTTPATTATDRTGPGFGASLAVLTILASALVGTRLTRR